MKKLLIISFFLTVISAVRGQQDTSYYTVERHPYPRSIIDVAVGVGPTYGIFGAQAVLGYKGSGLLLGVGSNGLFSYAIGGQFSYDWLFVNLSYVASVAGKNSTGNIDPFTGMDFLAGGKINLLKSKKLYLQAGLGYEFGTEETKSFGKVSSNSFTFCLGIGWRIAFKKEAVPETK